MDPTDFQDPNQPASSSTSTTDSPGAGGSTPSSWSPSSPPTGAPPAPPAQLPPASPPGLPPQEPETPTGFVPSGERKEGQPAKKEEVFKETAPIVEVGPPKELGPEVKDWMERLETGEEVQLPQPITDDSGQIILDTSVPQRVEIRLPLTEDEIRHGLHQDVAESIRWLAEWCKKLLKKVGRKFLYRIGMGSGQ